MSYDSDKPVRRQLAAIMFTDIAGYTSLMQTDEDRGMLALARYRSTLLEMLALHGGELLQHIGDGSLTMFQSAVQAVRCAIDLQRTLQQEPKIPVRAGIHLGDVVIEADSVYGDGVNVASRIEQLADPGSILISQSMYESIRSQRKFKVKYLGAPKLRNVMEPTRVYAIRNRGIVVPDRLTQQVSVDLHSLRNFGIAAVGVLILVAVVLGLTRLFARDSSERNTNPDARALPEVVLTPFQNQTSDETYNALGNLVLTQVGKALRTSQLLRVCDEDDITTSDYYRLKGGYYKAHDVLVFQAMITQGEKNVICVVFDPQVSKISEPTEAITALTDQILGFWATKEYRTRTQDKPPRYEAFKEYLQGQDELYRSPQLAVQSFTDAIALDADYIAPRMSIVHANYLTGNHNAVKREIAVLKNLSSITPEDVKVLGHWDQLIRGDVQGAFDTLYTLLGSEVDQTFVRMQLARILSENLGQPRKALEFLQPIVEPEKPDIHRSWASLLLYQDILMKVNRYEQLIEITRASFSADSEPLILKNYTRALCRLEKTREINQLIDACQKESMPFHCREEMVVLWAAYECALIGDTTCRQFFVSKGLGMTPESRNAEAMLYFLGGHYNTAAAYFREMAGNVADTSVLIDYSVKAAIAQLMSGDSALAFEMMDKIEKRTIPLRVGMEAYQLARLNVSLGETDMAFDLLEEAAIQGIPFAYGYFDTDVFLIPLFRENRFLRLTEAKD